jgi:hypothetical protein
VRRFWVAPLLGGAALQRCDKKQDKLRASAPEIPFADLGWTDSDPHPHPLSSRPELSLPKEGEAKWRDLLFVWERLEGPERHERRSTVEERRFTTVEERRFSAA